VATRTEMNVAEAKKRFSDLLGRVAYGGETILITRRGKPMARLVPPDASDATTHLGALEGWLDQSDPYFSIIDEIVASRERHRPRVARTSRARARRSR